MSSPAFTWHHPPPQGAPWNGRSDGAPPIDPPEGTAVSEEDYWAYYYEHENGYEWNNGLLEVKPVSDTLTLQRYRWLLRLLECYLETHRNARLTCLEFGFRLNLPNKVTIRKPDLGLVLDSNAQPLEDLDRSYQGIFDLCVEALSDSKPSEIARDTEQKHAEYQAAGVPEYYIIHHDPRWLLFYRRNASGLYEPIPCQDGILRSAVVPGFRFRLADLTRQPSLEAMIEDPVYAPFVLPSWQRDRQARAQAEQRADTAEQRANTAERLAERERAEKAALLAELARLRGE
ncbi:Uma2 family endonuclease [Lamprobacter modestohalophilus]|uniref:Uma2 family endonuclease n=1 Tax=Lamprobacter modestohalophilus TaxID=1064514 RepID=UPI002ADED715|nr:Uma2 family endonuclease [Lamprobacter modestohalophilus]MEA1053256.1 Uma2 family endonuclease [Lamprobacter modestohalophilus]